MHWETGTAHVLRNLSVTGYCSFMNLQWMVPDAQVTLMTDGDEIDIQSDEI